MKKNGNSVFILFCLLIASRTAQGQSIESAGAVVSPNVSPFLHHFNPTPTAPWLTVQGSDVAIGYFDPSAPIIGFGAPVQIGPYLVLTYGERITLPASSGFLDSIQVTLDTITADSILVYSIPDTLYPTAQGSFHLMNIFDQNAKTSRIGYIHADQVHGRTTITFRFPHTAVSAQNFWIAVEPNFDNVSRIFTNAFRLNGDSEAIRVRTSDNSHSGFLAEISNGQVLSGVFDSTFLSASGEPFYSEFYITAFVDVSSSSVAKGAANSEGLTIFPNPASTSIQIQGPEPIPSVELLDILGRTVLSARLDGNGRLDISRLEPGRYEALVRTVTGVVTAPVLIQR